MHAYVRDKPQPSLKEKKILPANPSQSSQIVAHQKRLQSAKMQKQIYQSQYHFDDDYENEKQGKIDKKLLVQGAEMHVQQMTNAIMAQKGQQYFEGGGAASYNVNGQVAKAMPSTLKTSNASRYYNKMKKKLEDHHVDN